jgi:integrase
MRDQKQDAAGLPLPVEAFPLLQARRRFGALLTAPPVPLSAPSILDLDARVLVTVDRAATVRGLTPTTIRWARQAYGSLRTFLCAAGAERPFLGGDVRQQVDVLQRWVGWLRTRGVHSVAVNSTWRGAASIFRWLAEEEGVVSPFVFVEAPRFARLTPAFLTRAQAEELLGVVRNLQWPTPLARCRNVAIVGLMLLAGLRRSEVLRLAVADVDIATRRMTIRGAKGMYGGRDRTSWMAPQLAQILGTYLDERARAVPKRTHPQLITHLHRNRGIGFGATQHLFAELTRALGARVTPHMLRHTYATLLRQSGVPDRLAMELLGHTSLAMLQRYSHVEDGESARAAGMLHLNVDL